MMIDRTVPVRSNPSILSSLSVTCGEVTEVTSLEIQFTHLTPLGNHDVHFPRVVTRARTGIRFCSAGPPGPSGSARWGARGKWRSRDRNYQIKEKSSIDKDKRRFGPAPSLGGRSIAARTYQQSERRTIWVTITGSSFPLSAAVRCCPRRFISPPLSKIRSDRSIGSDRVL